LGTQRLLQAPTVLLAALVLWLVAGMPGARAIEVWTPQTGQTDIDALPRETPEAKRKHALALIGAGEWAAGIFQLRELIAADPGGAWIPEARLAIGRALVASEEPAEAFNDMDAFLKQYAGSPLAAQARQIQITAAYVETALDKEAGMALFDRLVNSAENRQEAATVQRQKADALFDSEHFQDAQAEYMALINLFPDSEWASYAWFRVADCEWELAVRLSLGVERSQMAEQEYREFVERYPTDSRVPEARKRIEEARGDRASLNWQIALFYIHVAGRPWAAVPYLEYIAQQFPESPEAKLAAEELKRIKKELPAALRGEVREFALPGVERTPPVPKTPGTD